MGTNKTTAITNIYVYTYVYTYVYVLSFPIKIHNYPIITL